MSETYSGLDPVMAHFICIFPKSYGQRKYYSYVADEKPKAEKAWTDAKLRHWQL